MGRISKTELPEILSIARAIEADCIAKGPNLDVVRDFAQRPLINNRAITIQRVLGRLDDLAAYGANSTIKLAIPCFGWDVLRRASRPAPDAVIVLLTSAIAHELVHERQELNDATSYQQLVAHQNKFHSSAKSTPRDYFDGYYDAALEREAHATQAAAALWCEAEVAGMALLPGADPLQTEALRRPAMRLKTQGEVGDADIDAWWDDVLARTRADITAFI